MSNNPPLVFEALSNVQKDLAIIGIAKNSENKQQNFWFRGIDAVYNALSPLMGRHGVTLIPTKVSYERTMLTTASGKPSHQTISTVDYTFYAKDGSSISGQGVGEAQDTGDKSMSKSLTMALKYFLIHGLQIPLEGEADSDEQTHETAAFISVDQAQELQSLIDETSTDIKNVLAAYSIPGNPKLTSLTQIPGLHFEKIKSKLIKKKEGK